MKTNPTTAFLYLAICLARVGGLDGEEMRDSRRSSCGRNDDQCFTNWYKSVGVGGFVDEIVSPTNQQNPGFTIDESKLFLSGLTLLTELVDRVYGEGLRARAHGSKWSLNNIAYTDDVVVNSQGLTYRKIGIEDETHVTPEYIDIRNRLAIVQSGVMTTDINKDLSEKSLALSTNAATDGQRLVGAVSTGTHGSAVNYGSMPEFVRAIHIVIPGEHVLIQRASDVVITESFAEWLGGARVINDDTLFNAAVVSFGSFGIIHALIIEAEPLYKLRLQSKQFNYDQVRPVLESLDPSSLGFEGIGSELPFHFEVAINAYRRNNGGCFVRLFEKIAVTDQAFSTQAEGNVFSREGANDTSIDLYEAMGTAFRPAMGLLPSAFLKRRVYGRVLQIVLRNFFKTNQKRLQGASRKPHEWFTSRNNGSPSTTSPIAGTGLEFGVPADRVVEVIEIIFDIVRDDPLAGQIAMRFIKKSSATLGFNKYDLTATVEMSGPYDVVFFRNQGRVRQKIKEAIAASGIPHTYHWGQDFPINDEWVRNAYGSSVDEWKQARLDFLGDAIDTFSNDLLEDLGLYP
ncbi:hypothetical protein FisN_5Lh429 [Fistulifera solaris]|uniref:FAD-binding PCMH-type domain-containing protein n=1 Tax=Fistulifera solaris TaxID=1519565 RepID=A0A1Z5KGK1_FISSO|nr:hypothetical protein FisN_5Lh429 [Fistulifera solaris]|eukprot:GAX25336.1 hypothetical protein FisN_5Lh429 [Fistulifera solaris]